MSAARTQAECFGNVARVLGPGGLRLRERYGGWDRRPFDSASQGHVSVYQRD
jgi:hypothetical protein